MTLSLTFENMLQERGFHLLSTSCCDYAIINNELNAIIKFINIVHFIQVNVPSTHVSSFLILITNNSGNNW